MRKPRSSNPAVKFPLRFRTDTLSRLSDVAAAALLFGLTDPSDLLPQGVLQADAHAWGSTRFAWAAGQVAAEIAAAPGITVDAGGLAVVWEVAAAELLLTILHNDMQAIVERYIASQRKQIVAAFENWWDKYRVTLAEIESKRDEAAKALQGFLAGLRYV